jgi:hypothetical protein
MDVPDCSCAIAAFGLCADVVWSHIVENTRWWNLSGLADIVLSLLPLDAAISGLHARSAAHLEAI